MLFIAGDIHHRDAVPARMVVVRDRETVLAHPTWDAAEPWDRIQAKGTRRVGCSEEQLGSVRTPLRSTDQRCFRTHGDRAPPGHLLHHQVPAL